MPDPVEVPRPPSPATYAIRAQGRLGSDWSSGLHGMAVSVTSNVERYPVVSLTGPLSDQQALLDVLDTLYGLGLPLLSLELVGPPPG
jgi:hypothetical protein